MNLSTSQSHHCFPKKRYLPPRIVAASSDCLHRTLSQEEDALRQALSFLTQDFSNPEVPFSPYLHPDTPVSYERNNAVQTILRTKLPSKNFKEIMHEFLYCASPLQLIRLLKFSVFISDSIPHPSPQTQKVIKAFECSTTSFEKKQKVLTDMVTSNTSDTGLCLFNLSISSELLSQLDRQYAYPPLKPVGEVAPKKPPSEPVESACRAKLIAFELEDLAEAMEFLTVDATLENLTGADSCHQTNVLFASKTFQLTSPTSQDFSDIMSAHLPFIDQDSLIRLLLFTTFIERSSRTGSSSLSTDITHNVIHALEKNFSKNDCITAIQKLRNHNTGIDNLSCLKRYIACELLTRINPEPQESAVSTSTEPLNLPMYTTLLSHLKSSCVPQRTDGIFRVPGNAKRSHLLVTHSSSWLSPHVNEHDICSALKLVTDSAGLIPPSVAQQLKSIFMTYRSQEQKEQAISSFRDTLSTMPPPQQSALKDTIAFLKQIALHSDSNKMTSLNLGLSCHSLLFSKNANLFSFPAQALTTFFIDHFDKLFPD